MFETNAKCAVLIGSLLVVAGCANQTAGNSAPPAPAPTSAAPGKPTTVVNGPDGKEIGEYIGIKPAATSKFARLKFGMSPQEVMNTIGAPSDTATHETGKRWIPFYFGPDARRTELLYKGEGCLTFTGGNIYGSGSTELIAIEADVRGSCFNS